VHKPMSNDKCEHEDRLLYESEATFEQNYKTESDTPANILAQMGYPHRGVIMKEEMSTVTPMPELTEEVTDKISPRGELTRKLRIQANERLNLDVREAGGGTMVMEHRQRTAVMIAELYASGHNGTESTRYHGMLAYKGE
jgi:hypothetical protein